MSSTKLRQNTSSVHDLEAKLKRALADYANLEKRFAQESSNVIKFASTSLLLRIIELKDHLERAALSLQNEGINMILGELDKLLKDESVIEIDAAGKLFDPKTMEAVGAEPGPVNKVASVVQKGYMLHDRVLRQARVNVGSGQEKTK